MAERNTIFEVYAGSISGGGFPAQIQQIIYYTQENKKLSPIKSLIYLAGIYPMCVWAPVEATSLYTLLSLVTLLREVLSV